METFTGNQQVVLDLLKTHVDNKARAFDALDRKADSVAQLGVLVATVGGAGIVAVSVISSSAMGWSDGLLLLLILGLLGLVMNWTWRATKTLDIATGAMKADWETAQEWQHLSGEDLFDNIVSSLIQVADEHRAANSAKATALGRAQWALLAEIILVLIAVLV